MVSKDQFPNKVEAVVFDVGRVIIQWDLRHLFVQLIEDEEELDWFCANVVTEEWHFEHDEGRPLSEMIPERKALFPQYTHLIDAYAARFLDTIPGPVPGTARLIEKLAMHEIPLFAITNFGAEFWPQFRRTQPILDHFRDIVVSGDEKLAKPDPAIFELACQRFGFSAEEMLFIDDNEANTRAAQDMGWKVHSFVHADRLERDLLKRGLLPT